MEYKPGDRSSRNAVRQKPPPTNTDNVTDTHQSTYIAHRQSIVGEPTTIEICLQGKHDKRPSPVNSDHEQHGAHSQQDTDEMRHSVGFLPREIQLNIEPDSGRSRRRHVGSKQTVTSTFHSSPSARTHSISGHDSVGTHARRWSLQPTVTTLELSYDEWKDRMGGYHPNDLGILERCAVPRGKTPCTSALNKYPDVRAKSLYVDESFPLCVAIPNASTIKWMRPKEFCSSPLLIEGAVRKSRRGNIGQGSAGTCWFLAGLASLSEHEELLSRILPDDAYLIDAKDKYNGAFHCRFWRFGEWMDIFIDDYLPVVDDLRLWGAHSLGNKDEMWIPLIEKAFARLYGGYNKICGGNSGSAFLALTGGVSELIDFTKMEMKPKRLFNRIKNSLHTGAMVTCCVPEKYDGVNGLVSNHTYSLTEADEVRTVNGDIVPLVRVRNPWGDTKWTGAWSDGSPEWEDLVPGQSEKTLEDIGEFFMTLFDFLNYFSEVQICSVLPDYDRSGCTDSLGFVTAVYGKWNSPLNGGFDDRLQNPRYRISIPAGGGDEEGIVPVVIQIIQETDGEDISIRCDLYKVLAESPDGSSVCLILLGEDTSLYTPETHCAYRHKVPPGKYVIIPSTYYPNIEKEYLIRVFTHCPVETFEEIRNPCSVFECDNCPDMSDTKFVVDIFGKWSGETAAGFDNRLKNPKYKIHIENEGVDGEGDALVHAQIIQHMEQSPLTSVRCDVYYVVAESAKSNSLCLEIQGQNTNLYTPQKHVTYKHKLKTGKYVIIPSTCNAGVEKEFLIRVFASHQMENHGELTHSRVMESDMTSRLSSFNCVTNIFGMWTTSSPGGLAGRIDNTKYRIDLSREETSMQTFEIALQLVQETEDQRRVHMRCDLYKIIAESDDDKMICLELEGTDTNVYTPETQATYIHKVSAGQYVIVPSKCEIGIEKKYLLRIFSHSPLGEPTEVPGSCYVIESDIAEKIYDLGYMQYVFGRWVGESAAGYQNRTRNPKYELDLDGIDVNDRLEIGLQINQQTDGCKDSSIRCDIYKVLADYNNGKCLELDDDEANLYTPEQQKTYRQVLQPGKYVIIPSTGDSGIEKSFLIRVYTKCPIKKLSKEPLECSTMETIAANTVTKKKKVPTATLR